LKEEISMSRTPNAPIDHGNSFHVFLVDAFTDRPFAGNPATVLLSSSPLSDQWMHTAAQEMNSPITVFVHTDENGQALRWFTPTTEVELCAHGTLAAVHVLREQGALHGRETVTFRTVRGGLTATCHSDGCIELDLPAEPVESVETPATLTRALGAPVLSTMYSSLHLVAEVESESVLRRVSPNLVLLADLHPRGVCVTSPADSTAFDFVSRCFTPRLGVAEDQVCGSAHCALGPLWAERLGKDVLVAYQASARGGVIRIRVRGDRVIVGGQACTVLRGQFSCERAGARSAARVDSRLLKRSISVGTAPESLAWECMESGNYESAAYGSPLTVALYRKELRDAQAILGERDTLIEVGCGTGKFCMEFVGQVRWIVGLDLSDSLLVEARRRLPESDRSTFLIEGDASQLDLVLRTALGNEHPIWESRRVVTCVMNTLGIMPEAIRQAVVTEMVRVAGREGLIYLVVFNGSAFRTGVEQFYRPNPQLCGELSEEDVDWRSRTLRVRSTGYYSHWFNVDEILALFEQAGARLESVEHEGIGSYFLWKSAEQAVGRSSESAGAAPGCGESRTT
jgi:PhzF family phenazine biosynthesis protein